MNETDISKRLSIRHIRAFVAVARYRSLTRAAESLFVTQSALSLTIQHLEEDLDLRLFDRSTRRLDLSEAGREFVPSATRLLRDFENAMHEMRALGRKERGRVGIAAAPSVMTLMLSDATASFIDRYPGIDLYFREDNSEAIQQRVTEGDVDFGIGGLWEPEGDLAFEPLFDDRYGVVVSPRHPLADSTQPLPWDAIAPYGVIGFSADLGMQHQLSQTMGLSQAIREPRYRVSNTAMIAALLARGSQVSVMSALAAQRAPLNTLVFRLLESPALSRTVGLLTRRERSLSPAAATMLTEIRKALPALTRYPGVTIRDEFKETGKGSVPRAAIAV